MWSALAFLDLTKFSDLRWKNTNVNRTQGLRHVIYIFFWIFSRLDVSVPSFMIVEYVWEILGRGGFFAPTPFLSNSEKVHPE